MSRLKKIAAASVSLAIGAACIMSAVTMPAPTPGNNAIPADHAVVQRFLNYHGADATTVKKQTPTAKEVCEPCAAKAAALQAGAVPSQRPAPKTDPPFQRITGRSSDYNPPVEHGTATVVIPEQLDAWVSLSHGMPFEQLRCHMFLSADGITMSSLSGNSLKEETITIAWQAAAPAQLGTWGAMLVRGADDIWQTMRSLPHQISVGQTAGRYQVQAVTAQRVLLVASSPAPLHCDDLDIQLSPQGLPLLITRIQATDTSATLQASRQIWFVNNP